MNDAAASSDRAVHFGPPGYHRAATRRLELVPTLIADRSKPRHRSISRRRSGGPSPRAPRSRCRGSHSTSQSRLHPILKHGL
jgi:hypothetical protein